MAIAGLSGLRLRVECVDAVEVLGLRVLDGWFVVYFLTLWSPPSSFEAHYTLRSPPLSISDEDEEDIGYHIHHAATQVSHPCSTRPALAALSALSSDRDAALSSGPVDAPVVQAKAELWL